MSSREKKAREIADRLKSVGQHSTAKRLVEAFRLDNQFSRKKGLETMELEFDEDAFDEEVAEACEEVDMYLPTAAVIPAELEDEQSISMDTGSYRIPARLRRSRG